MRLVVIGGGGFRVPLLYGALLTEAAEVSVDDVVLCDVDPTRLAVISGVLEQMASGASAAPKVTAVTDLDRALADADFVFFAVRVGGLAGRVADEQVAAELGLLGQETTGPGGVAYGLRTVPVAIRAAERVASVAPQAWLVNLTNPAGLVTRAMSTVLGNRVIGICDSPTALCRRAARALDLPPDRASYDYVGLNHLGWLRAVETDGHDHLPRLLASDDLLASFEEGRLFGPQWLRVLGSIPNEYLWYWYFHREAMAAVASHEGSTRGAFLHAQQRRFYAAAAAAPERAFQEWQRVRRERDETYLAESRAAGQACARADDDIDGGGYEQVALSLIRAIARNDRSVHILDVPNRAAVPGIDAEAVVEVPCVVDGNGAHPMASGPVDNHQLGLMQSMTAVEREILTAVSTRSREAALRAFALHPMVDSVSVAHQLLDTYLGTVPELAAVLR